MKEIGGRGIEGYNQGDRITSLNDVKVGETVIMFSTQFNALNLVKITRPDETGLDRDIMYGAHLWPDGRQSRDEFSIWGHDLKRDEFYRAIHA